MGKRYLGERLIVSRVGLGDGTRGERRHRWMRRTEIYGRRAWHEGLMFDPGLYMLRQLQATKSGSWLKWSKSRALRIWPTS